jgi:hypothetical protein
MKLSLDHTIKPFSHKFGQKVLFPKTTLVCQIFPNLVLITDLQDPSFSLKLEILVLEFIENFTIEVNYQASLIRVFGFSKDGFLEYKIVKTKNGLNFCLLRFEKPLSVIFNGKKHELVKGSEMALTSIKEQEDLFNEHLYLGVSKQQDMDAMLQRMDLKELLPFVFAFAQKFETTKKLKPLELEEIKKIILSKTTGFLVPTLDNPSHLQMDLKTEFLDQKQILAHLYQDMKQRLVTEDKNTLKVFFDMHKKFVTGKALNLKFSFGFIHIEWTKGFLRQVILVLNSPKKLNVEFPKSVKSFRLQKDNQVIGIEKICDQGIYCFDRFLA